MVLYRRHPTDMEELHQHGPHEKCRWCDGSVLDHEEQEVKKLTEWFWTHFNPQMRLVDQKCRIAFSSAVLMMLLGQKDGDPKYGWMLDAFDAYRKEFMGGKQ